MIDCSFIHSWDFSIIGFLGIDSWDYDISLMRWLCRSVKVICSS